jgi:hypothetical protein
VERGDTREVELYSELVHSFSVCEDALNILVPAVWEKVEDNVLLLRVGENTAGAGVVSDEEVELVKDRVCVALAFRTLEHMHVIDKTLCVQLP